MSNSLWPRGLQQSDPVFLVLHCLPEFAQNHVHWVDDATHHLIICALFSSCPQSFLESGSFPVNRLYLVAKVLELQLQHQSFQWIFRIDFFRIDRFDLLAVQGTLKSLLQHHNSKASVLQHSVFFMAQLEYLFNRNYSEII